MNSARRAVRWLGVSLALASGAFAAGGKQVLPRGWEALAPAMTMAQARTVLDPVLGAPLIVTRSKSGVFEVWTYDRGRQLIFIAGALDYWTPLEPETRAMLAAARAAKTTLASAD